QVRGEIINPVWNGLAQGFISKIMHPDAGGLPVATPFASGVLEVAHQLFLLGIHRDGRQPARLKGRDRRRDILELCVTIRMLATLTGLTVGLQAVAQLMQQVCDFLPFDVKALFLQLCRQAAHAFTGPAQGRLRISTCGWFDQRLQRGGQLRLYHHQRFASSSRASDALRRIEGLLAAQLPQSLMDCAPRNPGRTRYRRNATIPQHFGFHCRPYSPFPFIEQAFQFRKALPHCRVYAHSLHRHALRDPPQSCYGCLWTSPYWADCKSPAELT